MSGVYSGCESRGGGVYVCVWKKEPVCEWVPARVTPSRGRVTSIVDEEAPFQNTWKSWKEQKYVHGSRRDPKPRLTVLARTSNNYPTRLVWDMVLHFRRPDISAIEIKALWVLLEPHGFSLLTSFWKNKSRLMRSRCCLCVCLCIPPIVARQRLGRNVTAVTNTHATIEELLYASFSMWTMSYQGK
jgi:hypothetical protein